MTIKINCVYCGEPIRSYQECAGYPSAQCLDCLIKANIESKKDYLWNLRESYRSKSLSISIVNADESVDKIYDVSGMSRSNIHWLLSRIPMYLTNGKYVELKEELQ